MKKHSLITVLAAALLGVSAAGFPAAPGEPAGIVAEAAESNGFQYTVSSNQVTITKYTGTATSVTIPDKINGKKVVAIGDKAFCRVERGSYYYPMNVTSVTIPNTVKTIGEKAFYKAPLTALTLPSSVTYVGMDAFYQCTAMKTLRIDGAAEIGCGAFEKCTSLESAQLNAGCTSETPPNSPFDGCTSLSKLNGLPVYQIVADDNGYGYPTVTPNQNIRNLLKKLFKTAENVRFVDNYCTKLCDYVVESETRSWMSDAIKARQLYDWLIRHCQFEDENGAETIHDRDNHVYASVFLSYALDERGPGVGEAVCEGFSKAYTMLLTAAGIESYVVSAGNKTPGEDSHAWNIVKVGGKYYQCDVTWDDGSTNASGTITHFYFLKKAAKMDELHDYSYKAATIYPDQAGMHKYLKNTGTAGTAALSKCTNTYNDENADGILDGDFDFNGTVNVIDNWVLQQIGRGDMTLDGQIEWIDTVLYNAFIRVGTHDFWLRLCLQYNIYGL